MEQNSFKRDTLQIHIPLEDNKELYMCKKQMKKQKQSKRKTRCTKFGGEEISNNPFNECKENSILLL